MIWVLIALGMIGAGWALWRWNTKPHLIVPDAAPPPGLETGAFPHEPFEDLLERFADPAGRIDYEAWYEDAGAVAQLDTYLASVAHVSPESASARFSPDETLIYWLHVYNAFVIRAVLYHWPLESVTDIKAPIEAIKGLGFFYRLRFIAGHRIVSLWEIERYKIRRDWKDPRVHFVLSCASASCPAVRPHLPSGPELETTLDRAAAEFVANRENVRIDHSARTIRLSSIFKWYEHDFLDDLRRRGAPARSVVDYVRSVAPEDVVRELDGATEYAVAFADYDWRLNAVNGTS